MERVLRKSVVVNASLSDVWKSWTTSRGAETFFAPKARILLDQGGDYEILFDPYAPPGRRGAEDLKILSYVPREMLSFEWRAPPEFSKIRKEKSWVVVQLEEIAKKRVRVTLTHLGWRQGGEWNAAYAYFDRAWDLVLARLRYSFRHGLLDWSDPYRPRKQRE